MIIIFFSNNVVIRQVNYKKLFCEIGNYSDQSQQRLTIQ